MHPRTHAPMHPCAHAPMHPCALSCTHAPMHPCAHLHGQAATRNRLAVGSDQSYVQRRPGARGAILRGMVGGVLGMRGMMQASRIHSGGTEGRGPARVLHRQLTLLHSQIHFLQAPQSKASCLKAWGNALQLASPARPRILFSHLELRPVHGEALAAAAAAERVGVHRVVVVHLKVQ